MRHLRNIQLVITACVMAALLSACPSNPVREADTFEQKAYALYGTYIIFQGKAAELTQDASIPENVKHGLRDADKVSYPLAESLVDAALTVSDIRATIEQCPLQPEPDPQCVPTNQQKLANAAVNLSSIYFKAAPVLLNLVSVVKKAR